ncbi:hypothetical protein BC829DRAFT_444104 [Chytridium lagenaria]|nr:hypothetical protein BC829DRAFT_444104 [Chytridium lagenaria]
MASNVTVELEGEPLKKVSLKTTPAMSLKSIVDAACTKLKLPSPDSFSLKYQRNMLDLSLSVRFANLPAGAKLFLVKGRTPGGGGLMVLLLGVNLTMKTAPAPGATSPFKIGKPKPDIFLMPAVVLMNKEFKEHHVKGYGFTHWELLSCVFCTAPLKKTLADMEELLKEAPKSATPTPEVPRADPTTSQTRSSPFGFCIEPVDKEPEPSKSIAPAIQTPAVVAPKVVSAALSSAPVTLKEDITSPVEEADRGVKLFRPTANDIGPQSIELPDSFFELTPNELKMMIKLHNSRSKALEDAPLMTKAMRDREEQLRKSKYPKVGNLSMSSWYINPLMMQTMIRVKFPNRLVLQATFLSDETKILQVNSPLYTTPPLENLKDLKQTMWTGKLAPASLVYLRWEEDEAGEPFLKDELLDKSEEIPKVDIDISMVEQALWTMKGDTKMGEVPVEASSKVVKREPERQSLRLVAKDKNVPLMTRLKASLELQKFPRYSRPNAVHNRCIESGKTRGYISAFKLSKIVFRDKALSGELPGVRKSTWG